MTIAWYGHLKFKNIGVFSAIFISWGIALLEYSFMIPANKIGSSHDGGPFNMWQLKIIQEIISITVFVVFTLIFFKTDSFKWNHLVESFIEICVFIRFNIFLFFKIIIHPKNFPTYQSSYHI